MTTGIRARVHVADELRVFVRKQADGVCRVEFTERRSVKDLVESVGVPHCEIGSVTLDGAAVTVDHVLDSESARELDVRVEPPTATELASLPSRFALDRHLGRLVAYLRALGIDTLERDDLGESEFVAHASAEDRIVLSRDIGLLKLAAVHHGAFVRATDPRKQLAEIVTRFRLSGRASPFTRCMRCNESLVAATRESVAGDVPERVLARFTEFQRCPGCARVYWRGTHHARLAGLIASVTAPTD